MQWQPSLQQPWQSNLTTNLDYQLDHQPWGPTLTTKLDDQPRQATLATNPSNQKLTTNLGDQPWPPTLLTNLDDQPWNQYEAISENSRQNLKNVNSLMTDWLSKLDSRDAIARKKSWNFKFYTAIDYFLFDCVTTDNVKSFLIPKRVQPKICKHQWIAHSWKNR